MILAFLNGIITVAGNGAPHSGSKLPRNWSIKLNPDSVGGIPAMVTVVGSNSVLCDVFRTSDWNSPKCIWSKTSLRIKMLTASQQINSNCPQSASSSERSELTLTGVRCAASLTASGSSYSLMRRMARTSRAWSPPFRTSTNTNSAFFGGANFGSTTFCRISFVCASSQFICLKSVQSP